MDISVETVVVGLFAVLPGFVSSAVRAAIAPSERSSTGEWLAGSIVASLVLNAIAFAGFLLSVQPFDLAQPMREIVDTLGALPLRLALFYLAALYLLALMWGTASGLLAGYAPRVVAYRLRLTPISPASNVFSDTIDKLVGTAQNRRLRDQPMQKVPWLRIRREDVVVVGRLRRGSVDFAVDEPLEVFLAPAYRTTETSPGSWASLKEAFKGAAPEGIYLRVLPTDVVEVFTAPSTWEPLSPGRPT